MKNNICYMKYNTFFIKIIIYIYKLQGRLCTKKSQNPPPGHPPGHLAQLPWYLRQAPLSILAVVQSCYAHQSKAHDKIYNSKRSNPILKLPRIGL